MNREIKFRGKEAHSGDWVCGAYFTADTTADYRLHFIIPGRKYEGPKSKLEAYLTMLRSKLVLVESHTVGQFTGLIDSAGKEVYEFDIVKDEGSDQLYVVYFSVEESRIVRCPIEYYSGTDIENICFSHSTPKKWWQRINRYVVGNIFDNPELIKYRYL